MRLGSPETSIRLLTRKDAHEYQQLRLKSLQESPEAFLSDHDKEASFSTEIYANHLDWSLHPPFLGYFGIFINGKLAGYVQINKTMLDKQEHIVFINNLYILSEFQHHGLGSELLNYCLDLLKNNNAAERAFVQCTAKNKKACRFYVKHGFRRYSIQKHVVKWLGEYDDAIEFVKVL